MTVRIAALEYDIALNAVCDGKLDEILSPRGEWGRSVFGPPPEVLERLATLRKAAVQEYAAALEADEKQRIAERIKGW